MNGVKFNNLVVASVTEPSLDEVVDQLNIPEGKAVFANILFTDELVFEVETIYSEKVPKLWHMYADKEGKIASVLDKRPDKRVIVPVVVYSGDRKDNYGDSVNIVFYKIPVRVKNRWVTEAQIGGPISNKDVMITCEDAHYKKYHFTFFDSSHGVKWRKDDALRKRVEEELIPWYLENLEPSIANSYSYEQVVDALRDEGYEVNESNSGGRSPQTNNILTQDIKSHADALATSSREVDELFDE